MHNEIEPFLRWAGGKRWLAKRIVSILRERLHNTKTYFEPFLGSGAVFFCLRPSKAVLSDINQDLILTYQQVLQNAREIARRLAELPAGKCKYYEIRSWQPEDDMDRAVRFIYLNRNCYGGLYRENKHGVFNVPYGGGSRNHFGICSNGTLEHAAKALAHPSNQLRVCDFEESLELAGNGDIIYCDPTYREVTRQHFDRYGKHIFDWGDQVRLAAAAQRAYSRGSLVIVSSAASPELKKLYTEAAVIELIRPKGINQKSDRQTQSEHLLVLDPLLKWEQWTQVDNYDRSQQ